MLAPALIMRLQLALTAAAGALDVFCVTQLGGPFASVITGNLVQVGSSVVGRDLHLTVSCVVAVAAYAAGVAVGAIRLREVEKAQQDVVAIARKLEEEGLIVTGAAAGEPYVT